MTTPTRTRAVQAFTLVELLVVMVIISVLAGLLMPVLGRARAKGRDSYCLNNLRQLGIAVVAYTQDYASRLPVAEPRPTTPVDPLQPLPRIRDLLSSYAGGNGGVFKCPNDQPGYFEKEGSSYEWNYSFNGGVIDRLTSHFLALSPDIAPLMYDYDNFHIGKDGNGTKNVLFADGHVAPI